MGSSTPEPYAELIDSLQALDSLELGGAPPMATTMPARPPDPAADLYAMARRAERGSEPPAPAPEEAPAGPSPRDGAGTGVAPGSVESTLERIGRLDGRLRAFLLVDGARARREAMGITGEEPLAGTIIGHKDIFLTAGQRTTAGSRLLATHVPDSEADAVHLLRRAGAVCVGKLATHEFATGVTGTVAGFPAPRNPWDHARVPGGSSCGSAVAVAAGLVDAATATDTGGSIRIPSACCGVSGFKPTHGSVSTRGVIPFSWSLDHVGPIARTVEELARLTAVLQERSTPWPTPGPASLSFGMPEALLEPCTPAVGEALREAAATLEAAGMRRRDVELPDLLAAAPPIAATIFLAEGGAVHERAFRTWPERYQPETGRLLATARAVGACRYVQALRARNELTRRMERALDGIDVMLCPTLPVVAPRLQDERVRIGTGSLDVRAALTLFTRPFNLTGQPALTLPCGFDAGLPIGAQLVARRGDDGTVLAAGRIFQEASDWLRRPEEAPGRDEGTGG